MNQPNTYDAALMMNNSLHHQLLKEGEDQQVRAGRLISSMQVVLQAEPERIDDPITLVNEALDFATKLEPAEKQPYMSDDEAEKVRRDERLAKAAKDYAESKLILRKLEQDQAKGE